MLSSLSELITENEGQCVPPDLQENYGEEGGIVEQQAIAGDSASFGRVHGLRGVLSTQDALKAAEHGNSDILAA